MSSRPAVALVASLVLLLPASGGFAQDQKSQEATAPDAAAAAAATPAATPSATTGGQDADAAKTDAKVPVVLTKEEQEEKEKRKACKIDICTAFRNPQAAGTDISCDVIKSWRKEQLVKMVAKMKVTWPYGPVRCTSALMLKRDELIKAVKEPKHTTQLDKHSVSCVIEKVKEAEAASEIKFEFSPTVEFEQGKAKSAKMNWGKIEAPTLIKGAMWTATAADNTVNMLSGTLVEDINDFVSNKCDEVKEEWSSRK